LEIEDFLFVSVRDTANGRVYSIDSDLRIYEANFVEALEIFSGIIGCVHRAIPSRSGTVKVGFVSIWFVMDLEHVHYLSDLADNGCEYSEFIDYMEEHLEFIER
jgi:hypothetical protein